MIYHMKKYTTEDKTAFFLTLVFLAGLVPILILAWYDYPCADDFGFSAYSHIAWQETRSVLQAIKGAFRTVVERWFGWQGTFSSIFVMALQPALWGEGGYRLVPWIMIGAMSLSTLFLLHTVLVRIIHASRSVFISISMLYLIFATQCMVDKTQGFFWFNGSAHYMIPHSAALMLAGVLLCLVTEPRKRKRRLAAACFLAVFTGGSNYITALITAVLLVCGTGLLFCLKKKKECILMLLPFLFFSVAFLFNTLSPGNAVRQGEMLYRPGVIKSVLLSFYYCVEYVAGLWFDWTCLLFVLALLPFLWEAAAAVEARFSFRFPLVISAFSFCILSAMFTPSLFATGIPGGGRIFNIIFLDFLLLLIANLFYYMGWLRRHMKLSEAGSCLETHDVKLYLAAVLCLTAFIGVLYARVNPDYFTSVSACRSLISGEAAAYGRETAARTQALRDAAGQENISLELFHTRPYLLYFSDISEDPGDWKNLSMARYYRKESITGVRSDGQQNTPVE